MKEKSNSVLKTKVKKASTNNAPDTVLVAGRPGLRILVVEDEADWRQFLKSELQKLFRADGHYGNIDVDVAENGDLATEKVTSKKYDLITLDMNLGQDYQGRKTADGLMVLEDIGSSNSAFFVAIITGSATDMNLLDLYGPSRSALIQVAAQVEAVRHLPGDRIRVLNKPNINSGQSFQDVVKQFSPFVELLHDEYEKTAAKRNVFRVVCPKQKGCSKPIWEIRYDGGKQYFLPEQPGWQTIRKVLGNPQQIFSTRRLITEIYAGLDPDSIQATDQDASGFPTTESIVELQKSTIDDDNGDNQSDAMSVRGTTGEILQSEKLNLESIISGLAFRVDKIDLALADYKWQNIDDATLVASLNYAKKVLKNPKLSPDIEKNKLPRVIAALQQLVDKRKSGEHLVNATTLPVAHGIDCREMALARKHWDRNMEFFKTPGLNLEGFSKHLEEAIERGGGRIHYCQTKALRWAID